MATSVDGGRRSIPSGLIAHQIREIEVRIEQLGSAAGEVQRLRQAVEALREIDAG